LKYDVEMDENKCQGIVGLKIPLIYLHDDKKKLVDHIEKRDDFEPFENTGHTVIWLPYDIAAKFVVPVNYDLKTKLRWLEGYFDGDGCVVKNGKSYGLQVTSIHKEFLISIQYLLQTLGINPNINNMRMAEIRKLPDQKGGYKNYKCKTLYRLCISTYDLNKLVELGFQPKRLKIQYHKANRNASRYITVKDIVKLEKKEDTYCFKEDKKGMGIFNGILTGQCAEILEYSDHKEYAVCNLASVGLPQYINKKGEFNHEKLVEMMEIIVRNIDQIIDVNYYPVPETKLSNMRHRPMGIGVQGLANVYALMRLPFDSPRAREVNREIFETMYYGAMRASHMLAVEKGKYSTFEGSPLSKGQFQFDLWGVKPSDRYDWDGFEEEDYARWCP